MDAVIENKIVLNKKTIIKVIINYNKMYHIKIGLMHKTKSYQ